MLICKGDPLTELLREQFAAQLLRVPTTSVRPGRVISHRDGSLRVLDDLVEYLVGPAPDLESALDRDTAASISGTQSSKVEFTLAASILEGVLSGLGVPAPGAVTSALSHAKNLQFSFTNVTHEHYGQARLGKLLAGRGINRNSPASGIMDQELRFVDGVLTSTSLTVETKSSSSAKIEVELKALTDLLGKVSLALEVTSASELKATFQGQTALSFAYSALVFILDANGGIRWLLPRDPVEPSNYWLLPPSEQEQSQALRHVDSRSIADARHVVPAVDQMLELEHGSG